MTEVGIAEYFSMAEALGIIATLFVILYFSRKQMQKLSIDIETKIINDLDERIHDLTGIMIWRPELIKVVDNVQRDLSSDVAYAFHIVYLCTCLSHASTRSGK